MKRRKKAFILAALTLLTANSASFAFARAAHEPTVKLELVRPAGADGRMNYLIAGVFNQPRVAFRFLLDELPGGITLVTYDMMGWSSALTAKAIMDDATQRNYKPVIYAISAGDKVARRLEMLVDDLNVVSINPCPAPSILKSHVRLAAQAIVPLYEVLCYAVGWLSALPYFPSASGKLDYSAILFTDQLKETLRDNVPRSTDQTVCVVQSSEDELLDNDRMVDYFGKDQLYIMVDGKHASTEIYAQDYLKAIQEIEKRLADQGD